MESKMLICPHSVLIFYIQVFKNRNIEVRKIKLIKYFDNYDSIVIKGAWG